jgi:hypothetical protein
MEMIMCPTPFIIGIPVSFQLLDLSNTSENDQVVYDIDEKKLYKSTYPVPYLKGLKDKLANLFVQIEKNESGTYQKIIQLIYNTINDEITHKIRECNFMEYKPYDPLDALIVKVASISSKDREFYINMAKTQMASNVFNN